MMSERNFWENETVNTREVEDRFEPKKTLQSFRNRVVDKLILYEKDWYRLSRINFMDVMKRISHMIGKVQPLKAQ